MLRILAIILLLPALAHAEGMKHSVKSKDAPPLRKIELYCTDSNGQRRELGAVICITASCLTWTAKCDMSLNNVMWRKLQDGCPAVSVIDQLKLLQQG
jgi:hypothetical protein